MPIFKRIPGIKHPYVRRIIQFQVALAGIVARSIGRIQILAIHALDVIAAVGLFDDPADAVVSGCSGCERNTGETCVDIAGAAAVGSVRGSVNT